MIFGLDSGVRALGGKEIGNVRFRRCGRVSVSVEGPSQVQGVELVGTWFYFEVVRTVVVTSGSAARDLKLQRRCCLRVGHLCLLPSCPWMLVGDVACLSRLGPRVLLYLDSHAA